MNPMKTSRFRQKARQSIYDMCHIWWHELRHTLRDQGMMIFFVLVPLVYPLIYAFIYTNETIREVPAVAVDDSRTARSREYLRLVDASPEVRIVARCTDMEEARRMLREQRAYGIIYLPSTFSTDIAQGKQTHVSLYCDMSGLLYYKSLLNANTNVSLALNANIKMQRTHNTTALQDEITAYPIEYEDVAMFNPTNGFAAFLLPAVLILIIQQTLLLGVGLSAGTARETNPHGSLLPSGPHYQGTLRIVLGKCLSYLTLYAPVSAYVLYVVPRLFDLNQIAPPCTLPVFLLPYLVACSFFAMTLSVVVRNRETCMLLFVFTSVPLLFLSGISWPVSAMPSVWHCLSYLFPSTFGINGYVHINSMGATLHEVAFEYHALWIQAGIYFLTTCAVYRRQARKSPFRRVG